MNYVSQKKNVRIEININNNSSQRKRKLTHQEMLKYITRVNFKRYEIYEAKHGYNISVEVKYRILLATSNKLKTINYNEM